MIEVIAFIFVFIIAVLLIKFINRTVTIEEARTNGIEKARAYIKAPVLLEDYAEVMGVSKDEVAALIEQGEMQAYKWNQYTFVENNPGPKQA